MAVRPVFAVYDKKPYYRTVPVEFEWNGGFAKVQKQKNIRAIHSAFNRLYPDKKVLEISSKSFQEHGEDLSAFFLRKYLPEKDMRFPVECLFQGGKVFEYGGPYTDLYTVSPREARRDERLRTGGRLTGFRFDGTDFPVYPKTLFYDFLYLSALNENEELKPYLLQYDAFTDIEFNPEKSINCQAKAAAAFVSLTRLGILPEVLTKESFEELYE